jgi:hypothetical protein
VLFRSAHSGDLKAALWVRGHMTRPQYARALRRLQSVQERRSKVAA